MTPRVVIRPAADRDLDEQAGYYLARGPETANRWLEAIVGAFDLLARDPRMGSSHHSSGKAIPGEVRHWPVGGIEPHIVYYRPIGVHYRPIDGGIEVIRVVHFPSDTDRLFDEED